MMFVTPQDLIAISLAAVLGALVIIFLLGRHRSHQRMHDASSSKTILLYHNGVLTDATPDAADILGPNIQRLDAVMEALSPIFPDLKLGTDNKRRHFIGGATQTRHLDIRRNNDIVKLQLWGGRGEWPIPQQQENTQDSALMAAISAHSPQLVWQEDSDGRLLWSNAAFVGFAQGQKGPLFRDFDRQLNGEANLQQRVATQHDKHQWFDVTTIAREGNLLHFAHEATALVRADQERRDFVQTLGKTFADLSIGLAIFDKSRQLAMFNPALLDMTKLPVTFLSARPSIDTVLDRLRELRMMPEPKDYASWREQFTAFEAAAKDGTYTENWALPDGQTYRVTGRPHPNGAFAILFEDISAEMSLTRRFRSDVETSQAVLDTLPDAIAVFTASGTLVISNAAYERLWMNEADHLMNIRDIKSEISIWQDHCIASPMWTEMRDFLMRPVIQKLTQVDPAILATKV
ncbi:PAS-domain containing protein [Yoonia sp.]|uniref:PAS-domain containing protein n=1 Tax=Yoonia sp. TaxID=2212373 RepID=UPI0035C7BD83